MEPRQQIKFGFVFIGIWIAMGCWALAIFLTDETASRERFLYRMGLMTIWIIWSLVQIRNGRRKVRNAAAQTGDKV